MTGPSLEDQLQKAIEMANLGLETAFSIFSQIIHQQVSLILETFDNPIETIQGYWNSFKKYYVEIGEPCGPDEEGFIAWIQSQGECAEKREPDEPGQI